MYDSICILDIRFISNIHLKFNLYLKNYNGYGYDLTIIHPYRIHPYLKCLRHYVKV
jgi:uncharacterized ubiquitin-like protein YukD